MNPTHGEAPAPIPGTGATTEIATTRPAQDQADRTADNTPAVVSGVRLVARGRARYDRILVRRCCWCGYPHVHIDFEGGNKQSIERGPACAKHRPYTVRIVDELPSAAERKQRHDHLVGLFEAIRASGGAA